MKYINTFESFHGENSTLSVKNSTFETPRIEDNENIFYSNVWEKYLPEKMSIYYKGETHLFEKGNVMLLGDLVEITYNGLEGNPWGSPDTLEFDLYFAKDSESGKIRTNIDITYGDFMVCEFSIESPNKVKLIQHTTFHSKFDPSDTVFALEDKSLDEFITFLNRLPGMKLTRQDLRFLDKLDNWTE